jgi:hypothetical protein
LPLTLSLVPLVLRASRTESGEPVSRTIDALLRKTAWIGVPNDPERCRRAIFRAARIARRLGGLDSCLTRSMTLAALLSRKQPVVLNLGFAPPDVAGGVPKGHAWVTLSGRNVSDAENNRDVADHTAAYSIKLPA